uniref:NADH dehydrogenase subunit 1 n=1 Tax=Dicyrtomina ornata TaxID=1113191 RepID=UPI00315D5CE3
MIDFFFMFISYLLLLVGVLISVAFMILLERKVLGYIQLRKGPNKVGLIGIIQSFSDAIKLFIKEQFFPDKSNFMIYYFSPVASLFIVLFLWVLMPLKMNTINLMLGGLFFFCCTSFGVYCLIGSGWSSNSNYALIGAIRGIAQTVSYEVSMALIFLSLIFLVNSYNFFSFFYDQGSVWFVFFFLPIFFCWYTSMLAETNRTPFDFAEGESELVSGFNVEYSSGGFALLFLAEYASIIFMSYFVIILLLGGLQYGFILNNLMGMFFIYSFLWIRSCLPRYRYDKLMNLAWKIYLPVSLFFMVSYVFLKIITLFSGF